MTDVITRMLHAIDALDWPTVRKSFAAEVRVDYTSLFGGEPETVPADELIARWQGLLPGFDATQHLTGPVVISDGTAHTHVRAHHWLADDSWTVHGHYVITLSGGKIAGLTLETFHQDGDRNLPAVAAERVSSGAGRPSG